MARELGMNPKKLGKLDNPHAEPWKLPLPEFIEKLYFRRFGKRVPDIVTSIEERARQLERKKSARRAAKAARRAMAVEAPPASTGSNSKSATDGRGSSS